MAGNLLTEEQRVELKRYFTMADISGDGEIGIKELGAFMQQLGRWDITEGELQDMISDVDLDGNQELDFVEFLNMMASPFAHADTDQELRDIFAEFDRDGDGRLSVADLLESLLSLGFNYTKVEAQEMVTDAADTGDTGRISYKAFKLVMSSL
jgi:calmodulin